MKRLIGSEGGPLICVPLVARDEAALRAELAALLPKGPEAVEWRADFFSELGREEEILRIASWLAEAVGDRCLIFTLRSEREGGQSTGLSEGRAMRLTARVCAEARPDYVDWELGSDPGIGSELLAEARNAGVRVIGSYHNFGSTPAAELLVGRFLEAERRGFDVAKVAVMPRDMGDVLVLLGATLEGRGRVGIPLITMSMGALGAVTRMVGGLFGSSLTFASGQAASAPGQMPIEELKAALNLAGRSLRDAPDEAPRT